MLLTKAGVVVVSELSEMLGHDDNEPKDKTKKGGWSQAARDKAAAARKKHKGAALPQSNKKKPQSQAATAKSKKVAQARAKVAQARKANDADKKKNPFRRMSDKDLAKADKKTTDWVNTAGGTFAKNPNNKKARAEYMRALAQSAAIGRAQGDTKGVAFVMRKLAQLRKGGIDDD